MTPISALSALQTLKPNDLSKTDVFGRDVLHIIALLNRPDCMAEILANPHLSQKLCLSDHIDKESGANLLHLALQDGHIHLAYQLLKADAQLAREKDRNGCDPFMTYALDNFIWNLHKIPASIDTESGEIEWLTRNVDVWSHKTHKSMVGGSELLTYGSNTNNQLGTGDSGDRKVPFKVMSGYSLGDSTAESFFPSRISKCLMTKTHSMFLTVENAVFTAGSGSRGRLGHGSVKDCLSHTALQYTYVDIATSDDHSLALTSKGDVYSWGLNNNGQLGYTTEKQHIDTYSTTPRKVPINAKVSGLACSRVHSCAFDSNSTLYFWGLNAGQMGSSSAKTLEQIKVGNVKGYLQKSILKYAIPHFKDKIDQVFALDTATLVLTSTMDLYVLTNNTVFKINIPLYKNMSEFDVFKPKILTKKRQIVKVACKKTENVGILFDDGEVVKFSATTPTPKFTTVWKPRQANLAATDFDISDDGYVVVSTLDGSVYAQRTKGQESENGLKFSKIGCSHVKKVSCDSLFASFAFIKDDVDHIPMKIKQNDVMLDLLALSPLCEHRSSRKKSQLLLHQFGHDNMPVLQPAVISKFLYTPIETDDMVEDEESTNDPLLKRYEERWVFQETERLKLPTTVLKDYHSDGKGYDFFFSVNGTQIGTHKSMLLLRCSKFIQKVQDGLNDFCYQGENTISYTGDFSEHIFLGSLHYIYTDELIDMSSRKERSQVIDLLKLMNITVSNYKTDKLLYVLPYLIDNEEVDPDVTVILEDGIVKCCSFMLRSRSAFFEAMLAWNSVNSISLPHISCQLFQTVLQYIHGVEDIFKEVELHDHSSFINFCLDLMELANELLLFDLKTFLEMCLADLITSENAVILLLHSYHLSARGLFKQCCWFLYQNIELLGSEVWNLASDDLWSDVDEFFQLLGSQRGKNSHWDNSDELITLFINDKRLFNERFLQPGKFQPIFEVKNKKKTSTRKPSESKVTRRSSSAASDRRPSEVKAVTVDYKSLSTENAIEDGDEEDFMVVKNRRRRKSSKADLSKQTSIPLVSPAKQPQCGRSLSHPTPSPSSSTIKPVSAPARRPSTMGLGGSAIETFSWGSRSSSSQQWPSLDPLSTAPSSSPPFVEQASQTSKITFTKVSQKQRINANKGIKPVESGGPWKTKSAAPPKSIMSLANGSVSSISSQTSVNTPSLADIMFQEEHKDLIQASSKKSLKEIQQEEEFERWWAEEAKRVQEEEKRQKLEMERDMKLAKKLSKKKPKKKVTL